MFSDRSFPVSSSSFPFLFLPSLSYFVLLLLVVVAVVVMLRSPSTPAGSCAPLFSSLGDPGGGRNQARRRRIGYVFSGWITPPTGRDGIPEPGGFKSISAPSSSLFFFSLPSRGIIYHFLTMTKEVI